MQVEPDPVEFPAPLFITGCMRSGTSVLVEKLCRHPQLLRIGMELNDIWTAIGGASCKGVCEHKTEDDVSSEATANMVAYMMRYIELAQRPQRYLMRIRNRYLSGGNSVFKDFDRIIPVNKSPHLMNKLRYVHGMFPQAKFVFIIRSIEGHSASTKVFFDREYRQSGRKNYLPRDDKGCYARFYPWEKVRGADLNRCYPDDFSIIPEMWIRLNALALEEITHLPPEQVMIIAYEDLITRQAETLQEVFTFIDPDAQHRSKTHKIIHEPMKVFNTSTKGNPLEKWRHLLSADELAVIQSVKARYPSWLGYIHRQLAAREVPQYV